MINIVLVHPEIPNNTGNIGRLCLGGNARLHLIKPFGFELDDKRLKRAGLDYWPHIDLCVYDSFEEFYNKTKPKSMAFLSSKATKRYTQIPFNDEVYLIFGKESSGLDAELLEQYKDLVYTIPLMSDQIRSLNLANAVAITLYEANRQLNNF
jgi:tRNA (cytidine/uridine-2'-O-)-methyltransferase